MKTTFYLPVVPLSIALSAVLLLSGCQAVSTSVSKSELNVQTKMSDTIFVEPVAPEKRIIFIDVRNTSDKDLNVADQVKQIIKSRGFTLTDNPDKANYMLQAVILQVGNTNLNGNTSALESGFGGAVVGAGLGSAVSGSNQDAVVGGLLGAAAGVVGDALVKDTVYTMVTDVQVRERPNKGETVTQTQKASAEQGASTRLQQSVSGAASEWKIYRTRIVSTANKSNLSFEEAKDPLVQGLIRSLSGIF